MYAWETEKSYGGVTAIEERIKIMYNEDIRSPTHSVPHYISYLLRYVSEIRNQKSTSDTSNDRVVQGPLSGRREARPTNAASQRSSDSISPLSYFIRKLKLDLKMSFPSFVEEFIQAPNNGLRLLLSLLKIVQAASLNPTGSFNKTAAKGTLKMENYKQNMVDEQDCLLCIKYTLRIRAAVDQILQHNSALFTITTCLLSNFSRSRIVALEILTLAINGPSSVDKVLEAFTSMRIKYGESTRFKMLVNMMHTRGVSHVLFQVSCLRLLNTILNLSKSANMRVFLQYEMEEAGLDWKQIQEGAQGDGLEYDDLRKEIREWRMRYIDVDAILRKIKADVKTEFSTSAVSEFSYDQHYGPFYRGTVESDVEGIRATSTSTEECSQWRRQELQNESMFPHPHEAKQSTSELFTVSCNKTTAKAHNRYSDTEHHNVQPERHVDDVGVSRTRMGNTKSTLLTPEDNKTKRISITSEIYEPYGLIMKVHPLSASANETGTDEKNWILGSLDTFQGVELSKKKQQTDRRLQANIGQGKINTQVRVNDRYDSGVFVNYQDTDPDDEMAKIYWKNSYQQVKMTSDHQEHNNSNNDKEMKQGDIKQERRNIADRKNSIEQGPLRWYNPGINTSCSMKSPVVAQQNYSSSIDQNVNRQMKTRTPTPDYMHDDTADSEPLFSPEQSSTMRAGVKTTAAKTLIWLGKMEHLVNDVPKENSNFSLVAKDKTSDTQKHYHPQRRHTDIQTQSGSDSTLHEAVTRFDSNRNARNQSIINKQSQNMSKLSSIKNTISELLNQPAASHTDHPGNNHGIIRPDNSSSMIEKANVSSSNCNMESFTLVKETKEPSNEFMHPEKSLHQTSVSRDEKHISRSLIYVSTNKLEQDTRHNAQWDRSITNHVQNSKKDKMTTRRSSVSDNRPTIERKRRNSLLAVEDNGKIQGDKKKDASTMKTEWSGMDSLRSYSAEIGRVLKDLDQALEKHGWQPSLKSHVKQQRPPLVAYI